MEAKEFTREDMIRFAYWLRNGLNNLEYAQKRTESHLDYWIENKS